MCPSILIGQKINMTLLFLGLTAILAEPDKNLRYRIIMSRLSFTISPCDPVSKKFPNCRL